MMNTTPAPMSPIDSDQTHAEAAVLRRIEAGVLADAVLHGEFPGPADASEAELRLLVADGDRARQTLLDAHRGLVGWVAGQVAQRTGLERAELVQEGMIGLLEAIWRFDPARGNFATCALPRIRMRVWDAAVTGHGSLGLPARRARQWRHLRAVAGRLAVRLGREPEASEIADEAGESLATVERLLAFDPPVALDPEGFEVPDAVAAPGVDPQVVRRLLRRLSSFDRTMICHLYGLAGHPVRTHAEVAAMTRRSESTIRRRERAALALMRAGNAATLLVA
ncbi:MAG: sigma-70 family RNA polymerase sigma factor [Nigerium sp.]|nr:sigma-70 family RNA polymerase sigma factor [Nigerium sp.]